MFEMNKVTGTLKEYLMCFKVFLVTSWISKTGYKQNYNQIEKERVDLQWAKKELI